MATLLGEWQEAVVANQVLQECQCNPYWPRTNCFAQIVKRTTRLSLRCMHMRGLCVKEVLQLLPVKLADARGSGSEGNSNQFCKRNCLAYGSLSKSLCRMWDVLSSSFSKTDLLHSVSSPTLDVYYSAGCLVFVILWSRHWLLHHRMNSVSQS